MPQVYRCKCLGYGEQEGRRQEAVRTHADEDARQNSAPNGERTDRDHLVYDDHATSALLKFPTLVGQDVPTSLKSGTSAINRLRVPHALWRRVLPVVRSFSSCCIRAVAVQVLSIRPTAALMSISWSPLHIYGQ
eukprot:scpid105088/ scgid1821/ 